MKSPEALRWLNFAHTLLEGDGTYTWTGEPFTPDHGYQVGGIATLKDPATPEWLAEWLAERFPGLHSEPTTYLGSWRDPETGTLYIDVTEHVTRETGGFLEALALAVTSGEKAIWNWTKREAISVEVRHN